MSVLREVTGLERYRRLSEEWVDPEKERPNYAAEVLGRSKVEALRAEGGPFDGVELSAPPGASQVILPAAFGDGDMRGKVIYERRGDRMVYVGQPDQTDEAHTDEDPKLILP